MENNLSNKALGLKQGIYKHYKGNFYQVFGVCVHSETQEELVLYQALYNDYRFWVRPLNMFTENVTLPSGDIVPRFEFVAQNR